MRQMFRNGVLMLLPLLLLLSSCGGTEKSSYDTRVIAHRGFWDIEGSAQNSLASLRKATEYNIYGIEVDVRLTKDSVLVLFHDHDHNSVPVADITYAELAAYPLSNGETLPTFEQFLQLLKESPEIEFVCEVKHSSDSLDLIVAEEVVDLLNQYELLDRTEFISFSMPICLDLKRLAPDTNVAFLTGEMSPREVKAYGLDGIDYDYKALLQHPEWISEADELDMEVNCWTVNSEEDLLRILELGVDYVTTDAPLLAMELIEKGGK